MEPFEQAHCSMDQPLCDEWVILRYFALTEKVYYYVGIKFGKRVVINLSPDFTRSIPLHAILFKALISHVIHEPEFLFHHMCYFYYGPIV